MQLLAVQTHRRNRVQYFFVADGKGGHLFAQELAEATIAKIVAAYRKYEREEIARRKG